MKVLITGAAGYLGSLTAQYLVSKRITVTGIDLKNAPLNINPEYYTHYQCCITDKDSLSRIICEVNPECIIHFASTFNKIRDKDKERFIDVGGSVNLLNTAVSTASVKQMIYASSATVYGGHPDNPAMMDESTEVRPNNYSYCLNKKKVEDIFLSEHRRTDLRIIVARICTVTGPSFSSDRVSLILLTRFPFLPKFCKFNRIQLLHEKDFVHIMEKLIRGHPESGIYNIAPDTSSVVADLVPEKHYFFLPHKFIKAILWVLWNLKLLNLQPGALDPGLFPIVMDPSKIKKLFKYKFRYTTKSAFRDSVGMGNQELRMT